MGLWTDRWIPWLVGLGMFVIPLSAQAQPWSGIIAPSRATDWRGVGASIQNRTVVCQTIAPYSGSAAAINSAIAACPSGQVVQLGAGTFNLSTGIELNKDNVTLRGQGASSTILQITGDTGNSCHLGEPRRLNICAGGGNIGIDSAENTATWTSGYAQGTTTISLDGTLNLTVGHTIWIDQFDDTSDQPSAPGVKFCGDSTSCSNQGGGNIYARSNRGLVEGHIVVSCGTSTPGAPCSSTTVTISPGIMAPTFRAGQSPGAWWANPSTLLVGAGLEDMTVDTTGSNYGVFVVNATDTWISGVRIMRSDTVSSGEHRLLNLADAMKSSPQHSYIYVPQATGVISNYGLAVQVTSRSLFQNNIFHSQLNPVVLNSPFYANVFAYNYFDSTVLGNTQASFIEHGMGAYNLYEGNNGKNYSGDIIHAPHFFQTLFRNHFDGSTHNQSNTETQAGIALYSFNRYFNAIGNVFGGPNWDTYQANQAHDTSAVYETGWQGTGSGTPVPNDPNVATTLLRWGNYDKVTNTVRFVGTEVPSGIANFSNPVPGSQVLPASLYLTAQPSWWSTPFGTSPFPAIGPEVAGGPLANTAGHAYKIP